MLITAPDIIALWNMQKTRVPDDWKKKLTVSIVLVSAIHTPHMHTLVFFSDKSNEWYGAMAHLGGESTCGQKTAFAYVTGNLSLDSEHTLRRCLSRIVTCRNP